jgi:uncharacterized protein YggE
MRITAIAAAALLAVPAAAQTPPPPHRIDVTGHGRVSVPPDTANLHYWLRGEGKTPDEAARAMVDAQARVESGLKDFLGPDAVVTNSNLIVMEARDPACKTQYGQAGLSQGDCAIIGYIASSETDVRTSLIDKAATAVGLASRLGARDSRLQSYELRDSDRARHDAMTRAVADAHSQAEILASAAGGHLGPVAAIQYGAYGFSPIVMTGSRLAVPPAPPPPPPPVQINARPRAQDVTADVSVSYELRP